MAMRATTWLRGVLVCGVFGACGGGNVDYLAKTPEEAASELAPVACDIMFDCGLLSVSCSGTPEECTASYQPATELFDNEGACVVDIEAAYVDLFRGCQAAGLSDSERSDLNACLNSDQRCLSDAELREVEEAFENGDVWAVNEACARSQNAWEKCFTCAEDPADPSCTG